MKTVAIDCRFAHLPVGLGRYTREIVEQLIWHHDSLDYVLIVLPEGEAWARVLGIHQVVVTKARHYSLREQWVIPRLLKKMHVDLLFVPHFNVPFFSPVPFVCTIHDLILHRYPNEPSFFRRCAYRLLFGRAVKRARWMIAVSAFTAREIRSSYGEGIASRVTVIHEGVSPAFSPRSMTEQDVVLQRYGITRPFFLYVGSAKEHKNVPLLMDAFQQSGRSDASLVLVTGGKEASRLHRYDRVRLISQMDDADLPALYSAATAFVTASLYEGFGLPVAEAAACGCPIIATNLSAIPEVAPEGSFLLPPSAEAFAEAMKHPPAPLPARAFSWEKAAEETMEVLRAAARRLSG